jgi:copper chaperone CopZ
MADKKIKLKIIGMHCTACAMSIDGDLEDYVDGVKSAKTNYARQECEIETDGEVGADKLIAQIRETGYNAEVITNEH